ncbi:UBIQUITIN-60S ribosomal protein L40-2 [Anaeramoeba flamelloides]|uniref:UBIQUITIN-60S ribosomal protein L40-2 n=1 Tax=Anaeramoeba flamelloides TaxID=1746091 RepID=A0AAV8AJA1_9EUKA|nr:UBIQUITIN-60S ribosomal protein L40-2 [Anaeramoeba flamelloides]
MNEKTDLKSRIENYKDVQSTTEERVKDLKRDLDKSEKKGKIFLELQKQLKLHSAILEKTNLILQELSVQEKMVFQSNNFRPSETTKNLVSKITEPIKLKINVALPNSKTVEVEVDSTFLIGGLHQLIEEQSKLDLSKYDLMWNNKKLSQAYSLDDYSIFTDCEMILLSNDGQKKNTTRKITRQSSYTNEKNKEEEEDINLLGSNLFSFSSDNEN